MGFLSGIAQRASKGVIGSINNPSGWKYFGAGSQSSAGYQVNPETAMRLAVVVACILVRAETLAMTPLVFYSKSKDGRREPDVDNSLFDVLKYSANGYMSSYDFWRMADVHLDLRGNFYALIVRNADGGIKGLEPINPDKITPFLYDPASAGSLDNISATDMFLKMGPGLRKAYRVDPPINGRKTFLSDEMFHIKGPFGDGIVGRSVIDFAVDAFGTAMAQDRSAGRIFKNGLWTNVALVHPDELGPEGINNLKTSIAERHIGDDNFGAPLILEEGMEVKDVGIRPDQAQMIESRRYSVSDIARLFRVPLHMIQELTRSTNNNIEHQGKEFTTYTMGPIYKNIELAARSQLLTPRSRKTKYIEFMLNDLVRSLIETRYKAYEIGLANGIFSPNEVRAKENENPREGGDEYVAMNSAPTTEKPAPGDKLRSIFVDVAERIVNAEAREALTGGVYTQESIRAFHKKSSKYMHKTLQPVLDAYRTVCGRDVDIADTILEYCQYSRSNPSSLANGGKQQRVDKFVSIAMGDTQEN